MRAQAVSLARSERAVSQPISSASCPDAGPMLKRVTRSREQPVRRPALTNPRERQPLVQAERPVSPELQALRNHAKTGPVRRARNLAEAELQPELGDLLLQRQAIGQRPRLRRGPGAELRRPRPRRPIGVGLRI